MNNLNKNIDLRFSEDDVNNAWEKLNQRILDAEKEKMKGLRHEGFPVFYRAAAVILVIMATLISIYITFFKNDDMMIYSTKKGEVSNFILPDGTIAELNEQSVLKFPKEYNEDKRYAYVDGEAYFNVTKDEKKPFVVETDMIKIQVLGTSFNVFSRAKKQAEVFVEEGKVTVSIKKNNQKVNLLPGQIGKLNKNKIVLTENTNINYLAWKTKRIVFKETDLQDVVKILNRTYNCQIEIKDDELYNLKYSSIIENQPLNLVLEALNSSFNEFGIKKEKDKFIIYKQN